MGDKYNQQMISHVERGRSSLLVDGLIAAAREMKVSTDYLLGLTDSPLAADNPTSQFLDELSGRGESELPNDEAITPQQALVDLQLIVDQSMLALKVWRGSLTLRDIRDIASYIRVVNRMDEEEPKPRNGRDREQ